MSRRARALTGAVVALLGASVAAEDLKLTYPETRKGDLVEAQFGEKIADPYRWLENDVRSDPEVAQWVAQQNEVSAGYLARLPARAWFGQRVRALLDHERFGLPEKAGKHYFYTRNSGLQNQSQLFVRRGIDGAPRLLLDPNTWAKDGATALDDWQPSHDGRKLAYSVQDGGTDWRIIRLLDVKSGKVLPDEIRWAKFTGIAWVGSEGFFYSRFPEPKSGAEFQSLNTNQAVYFHRVGTPQSADELVYATPDKPKLSHSAQVTHDGRWVVITTAEGTDSKYALQVIPLSSRRGQAQKWEVKSLIEGLDYDWQLIEGIRDTLYFVTNKADPKLRVVKGGTPEFESVKNSPNVRVVRGDAFYFESNKFASKRRVVRMNLSSLVSNTTIKCNDGIAHYEVDCAYDSTQPEEVIPERAETLDRAQIVGNRLILSYLKDAASRAEVVELDGQPVQHIQLNAIGTASGFKGRPGDPETFYAFTSFNQPSAVFRYDSRTGKSVPFALPRLTFDPGSYRVEQRFFTSKDGTRVPLFLVRKKAIVGKAVPTLLYGYGGFDNALTPTFSAVRMAWLEAGGAFALANLRGGGEYGKAWHDAGRLANKQNVFDDFIAAGEYLVAQGVAAKGGLAIQGHSNGGLLVGAVLNQRPDLFAAANPAVGVMDMLRFDRFTAGRYWVDDYGYPDKEADWRVLRAYSPYHNIRSGVAYPAVLVTTADTDDRVVPGHSFKYAAALQAARAGSRPRLIRIDTRAGHGSGKPTDKVVAENADILGFLAHWTGLNPS